MEMLTDTDWGHQLGGANQILRGEDPFVDWHTDYGPLRYYCSALAQLVFGERTLAELLLVSAGYTAAYTLLFRQLWVASGRHVVAGALLLLALIFTPRLYKYYVVLGPVVCLWAAWRYIARPSFPSLTLLAAAVVVTGLFRADFGAFTALGAVVAIATGPGPRLARVVRTARFLALGLLFVSPWLIWLAMQGGVARYFIDTFLTGPDHATSMSVAFPRFDSSGTLLSPINAVFLIFVCFYALPPISLVATLSPGMCHDASERRRIVTAGVLALALLLHGAHRSDYPHLLQAIPVCFVLWAWLVGRALAYLSAGSRGLRPLAVTGCAALVGAIGAVLWAAISVGGWPSASTGKGLEATRVHAMPRREMLAELLASRPNDPWLQAIQYVRRCTAYTDRVVALPPLIGVYYFADPMFGGGQPAWSPGFFSTAADQAEWIDRVKQQDVQLVLGDASHTLDGRVDRRFASYSPLIADFVSTRFVPIGTFAHIVVRVPGAPDAWVPPRADGPPPCIQE